MARTKKKENPDPLQTMEALLDRALLPESELYRSMEAQLASGEKLDVKPLKETLGVLQQLRDMRRNEVGGELTVIFQDESTRRWSE